MTRTSLLISKSLALCACGIAEAADHPGDKFHYTAATLARPYATPAVANTSEDVPRPANAMPEVPKGFAISIFADRLNDARWMAVAPNGDVFLAEPGSGK